MEEKNDSRQGKGPMQDKGMYRVEDPTRVLAVVAIAVVLIVVLIVLLAIVAEPRPAIECRAGGEEMAAPREPVQNIDREFVDDQIIITGSRPDVEGVAKEYGLTAVRTCRLNYLRELAEQRELSDQDLPFPRNVLNKVTSNLYRIPEGASADEMVKRINLPGDGLFFASQNRILGGPHSVCGSSPHSDAGSPFGGAPKLLPVGEEMAVKWFWEQWAFEQTGVGPFFKDETAGAAILHQGEGTLVGVFDTSPFRDPWEGTSAWQKSGAKEDLETVKWVNPAMDVEPLTLRVTYPAMASNVFTTGKPLETEESTPPGKTSPSKTSDTRDHGMFVVGLVHAVAPASEIRLIRVLNEHSCGDIYTLHAALVSFVDEVQRERESLDGVVINFSLGYDDPRLADIVTAKNDRSEESSKSSPCAEGDSRSIEALLCSVLEEAEGNGAQIVAAAGNDSFKSGEPEPAEYPAAYPFVYGVSASTEQGCLACFSNKGDLAAPGGEGNTTEPGLSESAVKECSEGNTTELGSCESVVTECSEGDCPWGVIGPVVFPPEGHAYWSTHYAYWAGSSFAAPLVSGLFALGAEAQLSRPKVPLPEIESEGITCASPDPDLPGGIIHLPHALLGMECPTR
jgi:hypothetical protein